MTTQTFVVTAGVSEYTWVVPTGVTSITMECWGGGGGNQPGGGGSPGRGGYLKCTVPVTPGWLLTMGVGAKGGQGASSEFGVGAGGNGEGDGGDGGYKGHLVGGFPASGYSGSGGGGATGVRHGGTMLALAGGGGASGYAGGGSGGHGGGLTGQNGSGAHAGHGGSQSAGGAHGTGSATGGAIAIPDATDGSSWNATPPSGGDGQGGTGGGGGGGYHGGGGGGADGHSPSTRGYGGGGGSSFTQVGVGITGVLHVQGGATTGNGKIVFTYNLPPNAPAPQSPVGYGAIDVTESCTFQWLDSFNEPGDAQTRAEVQYRIKGTTVWTSLGDHAQAGVQYTAAAGTFAPGNTYEWQVRVAGLKSGTYGPWSPSGYFTTVSPPHAVVIVHPAAGEIVTNTNYVVTWNLDPADIDIYSQQAFWLRIVGDDGTGTEDLTDVLFDSGWVGGDNGGLQSWPIVLPTGDYVFHTVIVIQASGVQSPATDVAAVTSLDPPNPPTLVAIPNNTTGSIFIAITNYSGNGAPEADHNEVWRSSDDGVTYVRVADGVNVNGSWTDYTPASGKIYYYQAVAVANTGAKGWSG